jgi:hypothetical protein
MTTSTGRRRPAGASGPAQPVGPTEPAAPAPIPPAAPRLSDTDVARVLELLRHADSVELKTSVPVPAQRAAVAGLPMDPIEAQTRQVFFFDTPDLALDRAGIVVRARRIQGGKGDTVIKLRPVEPSQLSPELRRSPAFNVELDALPGAFMCSASLKGVASAQEVRDAIDGTMPLRKLFSKEQRALFATHAPEGIALDRLTVLGPTFVLKNAFQAALVERAGSPQRRIVAEMWLFPDGTRVLEISLKCEASEAFQVAAEARAWLARRGIDISGEQAAKTRTALAYFSARSQQAGGAT